MSENGKTLCRAYDKRVLGQARTRRIRVGLLLRRAENFLFCAGHALGGSRRAGGGFENFGEIL